MSMIIRREDANLGISRSFTTSLTASRPSGSLIPFSRVFLRETADATAAHIIVLAFGKISRKLALFCISANAVAEYVQYLFDKGGATVENHGLLQCPPASYVRIMRI